MKNIIEKKKRGLLIVFEGVDRVGKSTQVELLKNYFSKKKGESSDKISFPDRSTQSGNQINDILKSYKTMAVRASHLLFSFNRWEKRESILSALEKGTNIIVDRYAFSGVVYSICNGADPEWVKFADQGLPRPDIVFQLDLDIDKIKKRENFGEEVYEKEEFQQCIRKTFKMFENYKYWKVINANQDKEQVHNKIVEEIENLLKEYNTNDLDEFSKNFYPNSIGEDLLMYKDI